MKTSAPDGVLAISSEAAGFERGVDDDALVFDFFVLPEIKEAVLLHFNVDRIEIVRVIVHRRFADNRPVDEYTGISRF